MPDFCGDEELGYERSRTCFEPGAGLAMDDAYRRAHLPLVAPGHPRIIASGGGYMLGQHERTFSLVLPVAWEALAASQEFRRLEAELGAAPFSRKVAWDVARRRRNQLHATVCGRLSAGDDPPGIEERALRQLAGMGPIHVELRGLFSGNVNTGRLYLPVYPERRAGANVLRTVQRILGRPETDLWVLGLHNLTDDLDAVEASALARVIDRWRSTPIVRLAVDHLVLLGATDDLVLGPAVTGRVRLTRK